VNLGRLGYLTLSVNVNKFQSGFIQPNKNIWLDTTPSLAPNLAPHLVPHLAPPLAPYLVLFLGFALSGCVAPLAALGSSSTAVASSVGTTAVTAAAANPVTATSLASTVSTGKSPLEHAASAATKKECYFFNAFSGEPICNEVPVPKVIDRSQPYLGPADRIQSNTQSNTQ
jgi:hypothetical protein